MHCEQQQRQNSSMLRPSDSAFAQVSPPRSRLKPCQGVEHKRGLSLGEPERDEAM
jgi:hypothetical protein